MIRVEHPQEKSAYRAQGLEDRDGVLQTPTTVDGPIPSFDTRTGKEVLVPAIFVVPEPVDHPTYILQWIRVGSSDVLVFYDCSMLLNLIQGSIADREGLPVVNSGPGKLPVGGGMEIDTVYRIYKVSLGP